MAPPVAVCHYPLAVVAAQARTLLRQLIHQLPRLICIPCACEPGTQLYASRPAAALALHSRMLHPLNGGPAMLPAPRACLAPQPQPDLFMHPLTRWPLLLLPSLLLRAFHYRLQIYAHTCTENVLVGVVGAPMCFVGETCYLTMLLPRENCFALQ